MIHAAFLYCRNIFSACAIAGFLCLPAQAQISPDQLRVAAEQGNPEAQFALAEAYDAGDGLLQNFALAAEWFKRAAEQGYTPAQHRLGQYLHAGRGVATDQGAALRWLSAAAENGNAEYLYDLGAAYEVGADGSSDPITAAQHYETAASKGHLGAQVSLATLLLEGNGVAQNLEQAHQLFEAAAAKGDARAQNNLGLLYVRGQGVAQDYDRAAALFEAAATQGLPQAMTNLGVMYENGFGVALNEAQAAALYRQAAGQTDNDEISLFADPRLTAPQLQPETEASLERLAAAGDPIAQFQLGWVLSQPPNAVSKARRAAHWFTQAAQKGHAPAMGNLGLAYLEGRGVIQDYQQARIWLMLASSAGLSEATPLLTQLETRMTADQIRQAQRDAEVIWQTLRAPAQP